MKYYQTMIHTVNINTIIKFTKIFVPDLLLFCPYMLFSQTNTWNGNTDTDWHTSCNWSLNLIPTCAHDVVIPTVTSYPSITGIAHCNTISITSAAANTLTINSAGGARLDIGQGGSCSGTATDNVSVPAQPGVISNPTGCNDPGNETFTIVPVAGATSYSWSVPVGATIISGQGTTSLTFNYNGTSGNVCVTASNVCGTSAARCRNGPC